MKSNLQVLKQITDKLNMRDYNRYLLEEAFNYASHGIVITGVDGKIILANRAFTKMTGYSLDDIVGKSPAVFKSGLYSPEFYSNMWNTIMSGKSWNSIIVNKKKDGSLYTEDLTISPVYNGSPTIQYFLAIKKNITEDASNEDGIFSSFASSYNALNFPIFCVDTNGDIVFANTKMSTLIGYNKDYIISKQIFDFTPFCTPLIFAEKYKLAKANKTMMSQVLLKDKQSKMHNCMLYLNHIIINGKDYLTVFVLTHDAVHVEEQDEKI